MNQEWFLNLKMFRVALSDHRLPTGEGCGWGGRHSDRGGGSSSKPAWKGAAHTLVLGLPGFSGPGWAGTRQREWGARVCPQLGSLRQGHGNDTAGPQAASGCHPAAVEEPVREKELRQQECGESVSLRQKGSRQHPRPRLAAGQTLLLSLSRDPPAISSGFKVSQCSQ